MRFPFLTCLGIFAIGMLVGGMVPSKQDRAVQAKLAATKTQLDEIKHRCEQVIIVFNEIADGGGPLALMERHVAWQTQWILDGGDLDELRDRFNRTFAGSGTTSGAIDLAEAVEEAVEEVEDDGFGTGVIIIGPSGRKYELEDGPVILEPGETMQIETTIEKSPAQMLPNAPVRKEKPATDGRA